MHAIRKWVNKPRKNDTRLLAQFYHADEELIRVTQELDSFDGRNEPERCSQLIAELKMAQEKVIGLIEEIKNVIAPGCDESSREFRVKFPDEVLQDNLAGQLWFGAECLCAGSTIVNREQESIQLKPLARQVVKSLGRLRSALREQALKNLNVYPSVIKESIIGFDEVFARFEFEYVSILSRVRSVDDHDKLLDISVLFCETVHRAIEKQLLDQELIEDYDPGLMITIPRLAIICGVLIFPDGPLDLSKGQEALPHMFKPFYKLLRKIKDLLLTLSDDELFILEKTLCSEENFDEVVLAADTLLTGSNYNHSSKSCLKSKEKSRSRRLGTKFSEYLITAMREAEKERISGVMDETTTTIPEQTTVNVLDDTSRVPPNLTIITEVEVHNSFSEVHHQSNSSSSTTTPNSTIQNTSDRETNHRYESSPHLQTSHTPEPPVADSGGTINSNQSSNNSIVHPPNDVQYHLPRTSLEVTNAHELLAPFPYVSRLPDDPPPPYSSGPEEEGYSSSGESDANDSTAKRAATDPINDSGVSSSVTTLNNDYCSSWPRPHRPNPRRETWLVNNPTREQPPTEKSDPCSSSESASCSIETNLGAGGAASANNNSHTQVSPDIQPVPFLDEGAQSQQWESTLASDAHRAVNSKSAQNLHENGDPVIQNQEESGSSTSDLFGSSSSETESEGLIPKQLHLLRAKFKSTRDLIHTLFVCISGVADQLQSNYASDLRQTLKSVFLTVSTGAERSSDETKNDITKGWLTSKQYFSLKQHEEPPPWIDDSECNCCARCSACFSFFKRRHHCRLCGKIFCSTCASNFVPLPRYGLVSPVRVCTACIETALDRLV